MNQPPAQDFQQRVRDGVYRGQNSIHQNFRGGPQQHRVAQSQQYHVQSFQVDDFRRPPPQNQAVYNPMAASMANQRHALRKRIMIQCEYLETVAGEALKNQMPVEEQQEKEALRQTLERIMQDVITDYGRTQPAIDAAKVKLKCYGSLASGFAVAGSDMDLLVTFPRDGDSTGKLEEDIKRLFEKALLKAGYGARLLTQTRVPIMRVCETPTPEILDGLRRYRAKWEQDEQDAVDLKNGNFESNRLPVVTREQIEAVSEMFAELGNEPDDTPLPPSPGREPPHLEYTNECGIQCDINFSNYVALHNTRLLRTYCLHNERVRRMGLIIKAWAKARKINTPYHGTLSSYGYIIMLLHFLMNVTSPPVIPNLQIMAKERDAWSNRTDFETVDDFDVRFVGDPEEIAAALEGCSRNLETLGGLLRGFFWYYSDQQGFHWTNDIVSIRSQGGTLTKRSKGWTEAKWTGAKNTIRNRYLLCIEDPFETEHNIARTVCHSGIVAIRDEFRRARKIIERVDKVPNIGWRWLEDNSEPGQDLMAVAEDRGDLLRKDYDFLRSKRLRADAEATERALKEANALVNIEEGGADASKQDGMSTEHSSYGNIPLDLEPPSHKLTQSVGRQQVNRSPQRGRVRQVKPDSDDEEEGEMLTKSRELNALSKDISENKGLSRTLCASSNGSERHDGSEPDLANRSVFVPGSMDPSRKLLPWDLATQEGRWLNWRDGKVRNGSYKAIFNPGLRALNEQCPFDASRPIAIPRIFQANTTLIKPPFPMSTFIDEGVSVSNEDRPIESDHLVLATPTEAVGWDISISSCRWLNKRDELMRAGNFSRPNDFSARALDEEFPYLARTPPEEQIRRNKILRERNLRFVKGEISQLEKDAPGVSTRSPCDGRQIGRGKDPGWDVSISDGRWLQNRDQLMCTGRFRRWDHQPPALELHDRLPYIAHTTPAMQVKRNLELNFMDFERLMAEIPEDVHRELDAETRSNDGPHQAPAEAVEDIAEEPGVTALFVKHEDFSTQVVEADQVSKDVPKWTVFNRTGKWLNERDAALRAGTWTRGLARLSGWEEKTNEMFPFLPNPTAEEVDQRNEALKHWSSNGFPTHLKDSVSKVTEGTDPVRRKATGHVREHSQQSEQLLVSFLENGQSSEPETTDQSWMKIQWDPSTQDGKWLRWCDKHIREGKLRVRVDRRFRKLDENLLYIEDPSLEEQAECNAHLLSLQGEDRPAVPPTGSQAILVKQPMKSRRGAKAGASESQVSHVPKQHDRDEPFLLPSMIWEDTLLGSWFTWRDNKMRHGSWAKYTKFEFYSWLERTLPYVAHPSRDQQKKLNEKLRAIAVDHPQLKPFEGLQHSVYQRPRAEDMEAMLSLGKRTIKSHSLQSVSAANATIWQKPIMTQNHRPLSENDFVRNQRLQFFASKSATTEHVRSKNQNPHTAQGQMEKPDLPPTPPSTLTPPNAAPAASSSGTASLNFDPANPEHPTTTMASIPQTLHKGSLDSCPRDEDPTIIPIPSMPGFAFDTCQMRDLNIIKQGGNGCARYGEEYNIEPDGEWGGGGWMACKEEASEKQEVDTEEKEEQWEGKGDEEGLLRELPCL